MGPAAATSAAAKPSVSSDAGSVTGLVTDEEFRPIVEAQVSIRSAQMSRDAATDATGRYTFNGLAPGEYTVHAGRLGFASAAKRVVVDAGATAETPFVLVAIAVDPGPRSEYRMHDGYLDGPYFYSFFAYYTAVKTVAVNVTPGAQEIVMAMAWDANTPTTTRYLSLSLSYDGVTNRTYGRSPLRTQLVDIVVEKEKDKANSVWQVTYACPWAPVPEPGCLTGDPQALVPVVVYQQRVKLYSTVFYHSAAPPGYTGLPA